MRQTSHKNPAEFYFNYTKDVLEFWSSFWLVAFLVLILGTKNSNTVSGTYFRYQICLVPKFSNTASTTFFCTKISQYRFWYYPIQWKIHGNSPVQVANFFRTDNVTFLPLSVPVLLFGTKFFPYRFRYHLKKIKIPGTGMSHSDKNWTFGLNFSSLHLNPNWHRHCCYYAYNHNWTMMMAFF